MGCNMRHDNQLENHLKCWDSCKGMLCLDPFLLLERVKEPVVE
jgi:hypothetical protein